MTPEAEKFLPTLVGTLQADLEAARRDVEHYRHKVDEIQRIMTPSTSEILLAAGEMTAAELRAVRAVLNWLKAKT